MVISSGLVAVHESLDTSFIVIYIYYNTDISYIYIQQPHGPVVKTLSTHGIGFAMAAVCRFNLSLYCSIDQQRFGRQMWGENFLDQRS